MLIMTDRAKERLSIVLLRCGCEKGVGIRLLHSGEIVLDAGRPKDAVFYHDGQEVLFLDPKMARLLQDSRIDLVVGPGSLRLRLSRISRVPGGHPTGCG